MNINRYLPLFFIVVVVLLFFWQFIFKGLLPIPSDTIIGLYHPFRDLYSKEYPNGIPFKNFLITDPVRQQYPWRELSMEAIKRFEFPLWNPYNFSGAPLLANFQSAVFYPLNFLFLILPFSFAWSLLILLEPLLSAIFLFLYLKNLKLNIWASLLGAITFAFSGFSIAWLEWGTVLHVALWLPLILLSIDKLFTAKSNNLFWSIVFIFSLTSSFFAGHLQTFFYIFMLTIGYFLIRWVQCGKKRQTFLLFIILNTLFIILTSVQWIPTLQLILFSARDIDQVRWGEGGWFIPFQHLIQFVAPDFFGNPATLNYWGIWNYGEFIGYIGIIPLIFAFFALFFRHDKKTLFYGILFFLSLLFVLPTFFAKIPYLLNIPLISTTQPTRLLFLTDFSLAVLTALGFDYLIKNRTWKIFYPVIFIGTIFTLFWLFILIGNRIFHSISFENLLVTKQNLYLPSALFIAGIILILFYLKTSKPFTTTIIRIIIVGLVVFDLFRFGWKFTPFTKKEYLFPSTKTIEFLQKNIGQYRLMTTDSRILPPNFSTIYKLQSIDGYDPLYIRRYGEIIAASERSKPDVLPPFGFNRIITPHNYNAIIIDLLGVKYILSLNELKSRKLVKVFQEGETRVYENKDVLPKAFFVDNVIFTVNKEETIKTMFNEDFDFKHLAVIEDQSLYKQVEKPMIPVIGDVDIVQYLENKIIIRTKSNRDVWLILTDSYYPSWRAKIDNFSINIYKTDYNFRGIYVPKGNHVIEFYSTLL